MWTEYILLAWKDKHLIAVDSDKRLSDLMDLCLKQALILNYGTSVDWQYPEDTGDGTWRGIVTNTSVEYVIEAVESHTFYAGYNHTPLKMKPVEGY